METYKPKGKLYQLLAFISAIEAVPGFSKLVFLNLAKHACDNDFTFIGQKTLARLCGSSVRSVQRAIAQLEKLGLIRMERMGRRKNYYLLVPEDPAMLTLAHKHGVPVAGDIQSYPDTESLPEVIHDNLSSMENPAVETHDNLSPVRAEITDVPDNFADMKHDNLSGINKNFENKINTPPLSPAGAEPHQTEHGGGDVVSSSLENDFARLFASYPCKHEAREAFAVFAKLQRSASLPPLDELLRLIDYEQRHNAKWKRGYASYLKNWLSKGEYKEAQQFIQLENQRQHKAAQLMASMLHVTARSAGHAELPPVAAPLPFDQAEFESAAALWGIKSNKIATIAARGMWISKLNQGLKPTFQAAQAALGKFQSIMAWLANLQPAEGVAA